MTEFESKHRKSRHGVVPDDTFVSAKCRRLLSYWREKAGGRPRPKWTDLNLMDIYDIAPFVTVRDVVDGGNEFRCRFCGTGMVEFIGYDVTGKTLAEGYEAHGAAITKARYRAAVAEGGPLRVVGFVNVVEKNVPIGFESVTLPLDDDDGHIGHIISIHDFEYLPKQGELDDD